MNDERRNRIKEAQRLANASKSIIDEVIQEEQDAFDALPESLRGSENGQKMDAAIGLLEEASNQLDNADSSLEEAQE
jgi:hypothetical protein